MLSYQSKSNKRESAVSFYELKMYSFENSNLQKTERIIVPESDCDSLSSMVEYIEWNSSELSKASTLNFTRIFESEKVFEELEESLVKKKFKVGILNVRGDQSESEIYGNEQMTPDFMEFLNVIGKRVELKTWVGYAGGLDARFNKTGTHSYHCKSNKNEIMYHVAPMIPAKSVDGPQVVFFPNF